jgi:AcrR family transcriptional regulator
MRPGRPRLDRSRDTCSELLEASLELFAERGYFGTSLRDIARAVGIRESAVYHYFSSKEALFEEILHGECAELVEHLDGFLSEPIVDARDYLRRVGSHFIDRFTRRRERLLFRVIMTDGMRLAHAGRLDFVGRSGGPEAVRAIIGRLQVEGWLRDGSVDLMHLEWAAPFIAWRHLQELQPLHPLVASRERFVIEHVEHFLRAAGNPERRGTAPTGAPPSRWCGDNASQVDHV